MVGVNLLAVEGDEFFLCAQDERNSGLTVEGAWVVEGVPAVQYPAVTGFDSDRGVAAGVAWHGDEHDAGVDVVEWLCGGESSPRFPAGTVLGQARSMRPLRMAVAQLFTGRRSVNGSQGFGGGEVDLRMREVGDSSDVVEVEVSDDDMADVVRSEAECLDVVCGGFDV